MTSTAPDAPVDSDTTTPDSPDTPTSPVPPRILGRTERWFVYVLLAVLTLTLGLFTASWTQQEMNAYGAELCAAQAAMVGGGATPVFTAAGQTCELKLPPVKDDAPPRDPVAVTYPDRVLHHNYSLAMSGLRSFIVVRNAATFLSFLLIILGALVVITGVESNYRLKLKKGADTEGALATSSPGLVLITLGAALVVFCLYRTTDAKISADITRPTASSVSTTAPSAVPSASSDPGLDASAPKH